MFSYSEEGVRIGLEEQDDRSGMWTSFHPNSIASREFR